MDKSINMSFIKHDTDMRNDGKIRLLRRKYGLAGYAVWCMMLEVLSNEDGWQIDLTDKMDELAIDFELDADELSEIIDYCVKIRLFVREGNTVYSKHLKERMQAVVDRMNEISEMRSAAGKKGAEARWQTMANANKSIANANEEMANASQMPQKKWQNMANKIREDKIREDKIREDKNNITPTTLKSGIPPTGEMPHPTEKNRVVLTPTDNGAEAPKEKEESCAKEEKKPTTEELVARCDKRERKFREALEPYKAKYSEDMLEEFAAYWTERNRRCTEMKCDWERSWSLSGRLATWYKKKKKFEKFDSNEKRQGTNTAGFATTESERLARAGISPDYAASVLRRMGVGAGTTKMP